MKVKRRRKGKGGGGHLQSDPEGPERLANDLRPQCVLWETKKRKSTLPLPLCDDTSQLAAGVSLPPKLPDRLTKRF